MKSPANNGRVDLLSEKQGSRNVLIISPYPTHPPKGGRMIRLLQLAKAIRQINYHPVLLYQDFASGDEIAMRAFWGNDLHYVPYRAHSPLWCLRRGVRQCLRPGSKLYWCATRLLSAMTKWWKRHKREEPYIRLDDWYDDSLTSCIKQIVEIERPCAAICIDVFMTKSFDGLADSVLRILDTNDLYAVGRQNTGDGTANLWVNMSLQDELHGYRRADLVWAIQSRDAQKIRETAPELRVMTVGHPVELVPPDIKSSLSSREILMVATKHKWNLQGLRWFAAEVYPLLKDCLPEKNVVIVGDISDILYPELPFQFLGRVSDLEPIYKRARLVISPILGGAGLKIKNIEPMGFGKAVVSTRFAATGLEAAENRAFLVGDDADGFAKAVRNLIDDDELCRQLMTGAFAFAQEWNQGILAALQRSFEMERRMNNGRRSCKNDITEVRNYDY